METLSLLNEATQELQQDPNAARIKKLLVFAITNSWETDPQRLQSLHFPDLVQSLYEANPNLESLKDRFREIIRHINKKAEYTNIANIIIQRLKQLYALSTTPIPPQLGGFAPPAEEQPNLNSLKSPFGSGRLELEKAVFDPFNLRQELMSQINPLRAKLLLYCTLHHRLDLSEQSLSVLKQESLDDLIQKLVDQCDTPQDLETRLSETVKQLDDSIQNAQAANGLLLLLKPLYVYAYSGEEAGLDPGAALAISLEEVGEGQDLGWLESETPSRITRGEPIPQPAYSAQDPRMAMSAYADPYYPQTQEQQLYAPAQSFYDPNQQLYSPDPSPAPQPTPSPQVRPKTSPPRPRLSTSTYQLVDKHANLLMITIENTLSELGNQLDERLSDEDPLDYLTLKHQVLRAFIQDVEGSSNTFGSILQKLEEAERRLLQTEFSLSETDEEDRGTADPYTSLRGILTSNELVRAKPELDQEIRRFVKRSMAAVKNGIENRLSELGNELEEGFQDRPLNDALDLKYQALRVFVREVEEISSKFSSILSKLEEAERRLFGI